MRIKISIHLLQVVYKASEDHQIYSIEDLSLLKIKKLIIETKMAFKMVVLVQILVILVILLCQVRTVNF